MEIKYYLRVLQRGWLIILITVLIAVLSALIVSYIIPPQYQTISRYVVSPNSALYDTTWDVVSSLDTLDRRSIINTYKEVLASSSQANSTAIFQSLTPEEYEKYEFLVTVVPETNIVQLVVTGPDPDKVVEISKNISSSAIEYINDLYPVYSFSVLEDPAFPTEPFSPKYLQNIALALIAGAIIGVGLTFLQDQMQNTLESMRLRSIVDNVSTAYTREYFERRLLEGITQNADGPTSLGLINFRGLEEVVDVIPQSFSNKAIQELTQTLREELRGRDLVGRWGNTELAVMLPSTPGSAAENTFRRIQKILNQPIQFADSTDLVIQPDPCIGITVGRSDMPMDNMLENAENAMEKASAIQGDTIVLE